VDGRDNIDFESSVGCEKTPVNRGHALARACNRLIARSLITVIKLSNRSNGLPCDLHVRQSELRPARRYRIMDASRSNIEGRRT